MKTARNNIRFLSLILVVVMCFGILVGCIPNIDNGDNTGNNSTGNNGGNTDSGYQNGNNNGTDNGNNGDDVIDPNPNPDPDKPHVCSFGDWIVVKEPTNEVDGLRERKCECGKVEQEVIKASGSEYFIIYRNLKTADYPEQNGYNSSEGLLDLPQPTADGYVFIGWYTASIGGDLVDYIPKGSDKDYVLYAHWDLVTYDITYKNVPNNTNPTSYNVESKLKLETPKWSGLVFTHWSDEDGNIYSPDENITALPEKMSGDITLTANWKVLRNIATPSKEYGGVKNVFSPEEGVVYFFYDLGTIEHVVLDSIHPDMYYKYEGLPLSLTLSKTVTIGESTAETISNTIAKSISSTRSWSETTTWTESKSKENNNQIGFYVGGSIGGDSNETTNSQISGKDFNIKNVLSKALGFTAKAEIEGQFNWSKEEHRTDGWTKSNCGTDSSNEQTSNTITNSIAYKNEITTEITENISINEDLPSGYYAYVHAGNIRVVAVVTYEISTGFMYLNTYSRLDNMHSMIMYYSDVNQLNNPDIEGLDFSIPKNEIVNIVENSYYVKYDANGGEGTMPTTLHSVNGNERLAENTFKNAGKIFIGWELKTNDSVQILQDGQSVNNLGRALETVTLKAMWENVEPVWVESESGSFYFADITEGFSENHEIFKTFKKEAYTEYETETTKRVVTVEWAGYVYWHWMYHSSQPAGDRVIYYKEGYFTPYSSEYKYQYFGAFTSTKNYDRATTSWYGYQKEPDYTWYRVTDITSNSETQGSKYWYRFDYYICTYQDYVLAE